jgi:hypothetical protein
MRIRREGGRFILAHAGGPRAHVITIVATEVVKDGIKRMKKTVFVQGPRTGSGRLGHFKIGPVGLDRLGLSQLSLLIRNTKAINTSLQTKHLHKI